jgi:hypothetical protein
MGRDVDEPDGSLAGRQFLVFKNRLPRAGISDAIEEDLGQWIHDPCSKKQRLSSEQIDALRAVHPLVLQLLQKREKRPPTV